MQIKLMNKRQKYRHMSKPTKASLGETANVLPAARQVAALCCRNGEKGIEILMVTSRDTGRWVLPKGWPVKGKNDPQSARVEAWEEAGVKTARTRPGVIGKYSYNKRLKRGASRPIRVKVYRMDVESLSDKFPEMQQRKRAWFSPKAAANHVAEPELRKLLRRL